MNKLPRGLRNNNPGNIRINKDHFQGEIKPSQDEAFKQFVSMPYGYRAMLKMLQNYKKNRGLRNLKEWINRWAPENENNTKAYVRSVATWCNIPDDQEIDISDKQMMCKIVAAMSKMENGQDAIWEDVLKGWDLL